MTVKISGNNFPHKFLNIYHGYCEYKNINFTRKKSRDAHRKDQILHLILNREIMRSVPCRCINACVRPTSSCKHCPSQLTLRGKCVVCQSS